MKNVSIQISQSLETIDEDISALESLYDWMQGSLAATSDDLMGLSDAIEIFNKIAQQLEREDNDGF